LFGLLSGKLPTIQGAPAILRLMDQYPEAPPLPASYYRRKAAETRRAAEEVTTRPIKARLHDLAGDLDRLADAADQAARQPPLPAVNRRRR